MTASPLSTAQLSGRAIAGRVARAYLAPRWPAVAVALICAALFAAQSALLFKLLQIAVNDLVIHPKPGALLRLPLIMAGLAVGRGLASVTTAGGRWGEYG